MIPGHRGVLISELCAGAARPPPRLQLRPPPTHACTTMSAAPADLELKRLAPVASAATNAAAYASKLAASAQSYVPEALEPLLTKAGGAVAPYASLVADKSAAALKSVDGTVDTTIAAAWQTYTANSQVTEGWGSASVESGECQ